MRYVLRYQVSDIRWGSCSDVREDHTFYLLLFWIGLWFEREIDFAGFRILTELRLAWDLSVGICIFIYFYFSSSSPLLIETESCRSSFDVK